MTFNTPRIPEKIKVGYSMEKVEQFVPNPLRCYRCQKYGHHEDSCRGREVCGKCGQRDPSHHMNECEFPYKCTNYAGDHLVYTRSCNIWREKEILAVKYKNNIPYHEARKKVVGSNTYTYSQAVQRGKNEIKYEEMVKKLIQLDPSDWGRFINEIKTSIGNKPYKVSTMQGKISTNIQTFKGEDTRGEGQQYRHLTNPLQNCTLLLSKTGRNLLRPCKIILKSKDLHPPTNIWIEQREGS